MQGIIRASARLLVMAGVMAAVLVGAIVVGLGPTTAVAIGIVGAGIVGLAGVFRRGPRGPSAAEQIAAMMAPPPVVTPPTTTIRATTVEAMAPPDGQVVDPEAGMPRWRRPSLLEARHSDPRQQAPAYRIPMRFSEDESGQLDLRVVRYAVVPLLDRPDEVLGQRISDLETQDEVHIAGASGTFVEVVCPNGDRGWVHRTTLGPRPSPVATASAWPTTTSDADDALMALLSARGLS
jgi:hypothetical protein